MAETPRPPILELINVTKDYGDPTLKGEAVAVIKNINLTILTGESVAITGPSGSGKTTLLNLIGALDRPSSGQVLIGGINLAALDDRKLAQLRNQRIGFVFQTHHLLPQCTVLENVLVPTLASKNRLLRTQAPDIAIRLLKRVGMADYTRYLPSQLSGGQSQRVAIVRALINRPAILLADEPTGSLDRIAAESLTELLLELNREENVTLIISTHAARLASHMGRVLELYDGDLCYGRS